MKTYRAENMKQLLDIIGAGCPSPSEQGPVVVRAETWTRKVVEAAYGNKPNDKGMLIGDVESNHDIFIDVEPIRAFAKKLLKTGESFFAVYGSHDMVCSLEWRLVN